MTMFYDGHKPVWQEHQHYPWNEYKHLDRDKFEQLVTMMIDAYPEHDLTEWLKRGFAMNAVSYTHLTLPTKRIV